MAHAAARFPPGLLCLVLAPTALPGVVVAPDIYMAGEHYATWDFSGTSSNCELKHEIPGFGVGRFQRLAGEDLIFRIESFQRVPVKVDAFMREVSPSWEHNEPDPFTLSLALKPGLVPIELDRQPAAWLLSSLGKGQVGSFDFLDWDDNRKQVHVRLSPVKYQLPYQQFSRCLQELSPKGFTAYRESVVHFPLDVHQLDTSAKAMLNGLADYVIADDSIKELKIAGHADDRGTRRYNKKLSAQRAKSVFDFLAEAGVKPAMVQRFAYGESRPKIASRREDARAANRRVEISLVR